MRGWFLVLGISWWCCGLLKLKFHSEVGFVCFFGNYFHHRNSVSEEKGVGRGLSVRAVLSAGSVFCCAHLSPLCLPANLPLVQCFQRRGDGQPKEEQSREIQKLSLFSGVAVIFSPPDST